MEDRELIKVIKSLPSFFDLYLKKNTKMEDSSVLSCVKSIHKGQEFFALFCSLVNYQIKVKKFLVPMLFSFISILNEQFDSDFSKFIYSLHDNQRMIFENLKWKYLSDGGKYKDRHGWFHRFKKIDDLLCICQKLRGFNEKFGALGKNTEELYYKAKNFELFLMDFISIFHKPNTCDFCNKCDTNEQKRIMVLKQFGNNRISSNTCFKRYLLFFRWMVGKPPDLNQWTFIPANQLLIPLDVHLQRIMSRIGIIEKEKPCKWKDVIKISMFLNKIDPIDPIYYDLAISRLGIIEICKKDLKKSKCNICPLKKFCIIQKNSEYIYVL